MRQASGQGQATPCGMEYSALRGWRRRFRPGPWDFAREEAARIDAHWRERLAEKPKLFDGRVLLLRNGEIWTRPRAGFCAACFSRPTSAIFSPGAISAFPTARSSTVLRWPPCAQSTALSARRNGPAYDECGAKSISPPAPRTPAIFSAIRSISPPAWRARWRRKPGFRPTEAPASPGWRLVVEGQKIACMQERVLAADR